MPFDLANTYSQSHLIVQPADLALNPPESYLFIQDGLIISCGVLYALCYLFYMMRTIKDKTVAGGIEYLAGTMAYEMYYAFVTTSTKFELACFLIWFAMDVAFVTIALIAAYPRRRRAIIVRRMVVGVVAGVGFLHWLCKMYPDEREQVTAYWTGWLLQLPISWSGPVLLVRRGDTKGQSLEIWIMRYLGCFTAYGVFLWRYLNVPENWAYVGSIWSTALIGLTLLPETIYPFVYIWAHRKENRKAKTA